VQEQLQLDPHTDPRSEWRASAQESRILKARHHFIRLSEQSEGLVLFVEDILEAREQAELAETPRGVQIDDY
jgi:hypothetical protein